MKKLMIVIVAIAVCVWLASDMWARGGRGGGGGGGGGGRGGGGGARGGGGGTRRWWRCARPSGWASRGGGGGSRNVASRTPSMSRPVNFERSKTEWRPSCKQSAVDG